MLHNDGNLFVFFTINTCNAPNGKKKTVKNWVLRNILCLSVSGSFLLVSCESRQGRADIWQDRKEGGGGRRSPLKEGGEDMAGGSGRTERGRGKSGKKTKKGQDDFN